MAGRVNSWTLHSCCVNARALSKLPLVGRPPCFSLHGWPAGMMKSLVPTPVLMFKFHSRPHEQPPTGYPSGQEWLILMVQSTLRRMDAAKRPADPGSEALDSGSLGSWALGAWSEMVRGRGRLWKSTNPWRYRWHTPWSGVEKEEGQHRPLKTRILPACQSPGSILGFSVPVLYWRRLVGRYEIYASVENWPSFPGGTSGTEPAC